MHCKNDRISHPNDRRKSFRNRTNCAQFCKNSLHELRWHVGIICVASCSVLFMNGLVVHQGTDAKANLKLHYINGEEFRSYQHSAQVTVVSSMYFINQFSKHSEQEYEKWFENFVSATDAGKVVFTDLVSFHKLKKIIEGGESLAFTWLNLCAAPNVKRFQNEYMFEQQKLDIEANVHSPLLYCIWNSKPWMLKSVAEQNPFSSEFFLWADAGSFRQNIWTRWPNASLLHRIFDQIASKTKKEMILGLIGCPRGKSKDFHVSGAKEDIIQGGFFGGKKDGIVQFTKLFYSMHDDLIMKGLFVGKEQTLLNLLILKDPNLYIALDTTQSCGDPWFFFQQALSIKEVDRCNVTLQQAFKPLTDLCEIPN